MFSKLKTIGPGALTAAAFIGPGTVTTATVAGAQYGFALVWALIFATIAAIILQEMAARLGVVGRLGLGEAIISNASSPALRYGLIGLIIGALFIGNAAYEGGNVAGATLGLMAISDGLAGGAIPAWALTCFTVTIAGALLFFGGYRVIERFLIGVVVIMSIAFGIALIIVKPDLGALAKGAFIPSIPEGSELIVLGLIGTTIVPYNLFLHAAAARKRWQNTKGLGEARLDTGLSIGLGGLVSILILSTAAASIFASGGEITNAADMARQLEPAFGPGAVYLMSAGLFAAGLTSAITAPLATGFAAAELFGFASDPKNIRFRLVAGSVLLVGAGVALSGVRPIQIILFAQMANGLLLPIFAAFLLYAANSRAILGAHINSKIANIAGLTVVVLAAGLGLRSIIRVVTTLM